MLDDPLSDLDDRIGTTDDDVRLLTALRDRIGGLLRDDKDVEREIRAVLQERYNDGELRSETYQLVKSLLDGHVTENIRTAPSAASTDSATIETLREMDARTAQIEPSAADDAFDHASTAVIPDEVLRPATAEDQVQVGSVLRDRFLLQERVSGGSMGVVYKALDRRLAEAGGAEPWVAIKVLSPQLARNGMALRALQQEAAKGRCLAHNHIVRFLDLDRDDDLYFIVMEWMEGRTLADLLDSAEGKAMEVEQAVRIVTQLSSALNYAHRCGIVHADVKPANVMILPNGDAKLYDFGVARVRQTQSRSKTDDFDPGVLGALTPAYSSMQVLTGEEPVPADDVFSLGCLLYRLVAGYRVFGPRNAAEAAEEGMKPQRPPGLTDAQWRALKKAISFSRVTRFQSMIEFVDALEDRSAETVSLEFDEAPRVEERPPSRSWLVALVAIVLLLGFAVYEFGFSDRFAWGGKVREWVEARIAEFSEPEEDAPAAVVAPPATMTTPVGDEASPDTTDNAATADFDDIVPIGVDATPLETPGDVTEAPLETAPGETAVDATVDVLVEPVSLPPPDVEVPLVETFDEPAATPIVLREDQAPVVVDLVRTGELTRPLHLRLEEVRYSGNRSPWASGQYTISGERDIEIAAGESRARLTLEMASDPLREADQVSTIRVRSLDATTTSYAALNIVLEDDDQRAFEAGLPTNTIGFAVSQVAVRERDPVVQIDVLRFNPDETQIVVGYEVRDITAREGEDYFSPGGYSVSFGPGQRSARLLIPLVQDTIAEGDEAFTVELATGDTDPLADVFKRIVVMIRDDETAPR